MLFLERLNVKIKDSDTLASTTKRFKILTCIARKQIKHASLIQKKAHGTTIKTVKQSVQ